MEPTSYFIVSLTRYITNDYKYLGSAVELVLDFENGLIRLPSTSGTRVAPLPQVEFRRCDGIAVFITCSNHTVAKITLLNCSNQIHRRVEDAEVVGHIALLWCTCGVLVTQRYYQQRAINCFIANVHSVCCEVLSYAIMTRDMNIPCIDTIRNRRLIIELEFTIKMYVFFSTLDQTRICEGR